MERRENLSGPINGPINGVVLEVLRLIQSNPGIKKIAIALFFLLKSLCFQ